MRHAVAGEECVALRHFCGKAVGRCAVSRAYARTHVLPAARCATLPLTREFRRRIVGPRIVAHDRLRRSRHELLRRRLDCPAGALDWRARGQAGRQAGRRHAHVGSRSRGRARHSPAGRCRVRELALSAVEALPLFLPVAADSARRALVRAAAGCARRRALTRTFCWCSNESCSAAGVSRFLGRDDTLPLVHGRSLRRVSAERLLALARAAGQLADWGAGRTTGTKSGAYPKGSCAKSRLVAWLLASQSGGRLPPPMPLTSRRMSKFVTCAT